MRHRAERSEPTELWEGDDAHGEQPRTYDPEENKPGDPNLESRFGAVGGAFGPPLLGYVRS